MIKDRSTLIKELNEMSKSYKDLVEANIKLIDEKKWAIEDKERLERRIRIALELINLKSDLNEIKKALEEDCYEC